MIKHLLKDEAFWNNKAIRKLCSARLKLKTARSVSEHGMVHCGIIASLIWHNQLDIYYDDGMTRTSREFPLHAVYVAGEQEVIDLELEMMTCIADNCVTRAYANWQSNIGQRFGYEFAAREALEQTQKGAAVVYQHVSLGEKSQAFNALSEVWTDFKGGFRRKAQWRAESKWCCETIALYYRMLK